MLYSLKIFEDTPVFIDERRGCLFNGGEGGGEEGAILVFSDSIMGCSASCVFRKLHGNNFIALVLYDDGVNSPPPSHPK